MSSEERVTYFAQTDSRNRRVSFGIKSKDRSRHMYVIGKTGMGKSTLLENMAIQDIRNGEGMTFIDPHGKSADLLLDFVPKERIKDVLYFAPFDMEYPVGFNIMEDVDPDKRHLVVNGLMSTFEKIWEDAWSARMSYILQNTIHALLEYPGATLLDVNRMYTDKVFRKKVVDNIEDPSVRSFWVDEYAKYTDRYTQEATPAIQNKIGQLAANPLIRNIVGQPKSSFDMRKVMDERKIMIVNLSKGKMGELNANLLGSMIINKIYLAAMSRADVSEQQLANLPNFYTFVDEFQSFANRSFADILSESRKYKLNLTMAHQYIEQMSDEVRAAVFGNVGTLITFRVGAYDAEVLEKEFSPTFTMEDIVNLGFAQIYLKLMIDGVSSPPFSAQTLPPIRQIEDSHRAEIIDASRYQFTSTRQEVESMIKEKGEPDATANTKDAGHQDSKTQKSRTEPKTQQQGGDRRNTDERGSDNRFEKQKEKKKAPEEGKNDLRSILSTIVPQIKESKKKENDKKPSKTTQKTQDTSSKEPTETDSRQELRDILKQKGVLGRVNDKQDARAQQANEHKDDQQHRRTQASPTQRAEQQNDGDSQQISSQPKERGPIHSSQSSGSQKTSNQEAGEKSQDNPRPKEIPEDVLDSMLRVDEDES